MTHNHTDTASRIGELGEQISHTASELKSNMRENYDRTKDSVARASELTDQYVRENPWMMVCAAAGIGLLLGVIISRK